MKTIENCLKVFLSDQIDRDVQNKNFNVAYQQYAFANATKVTTPLAEKILLTFTKKRKMINLTSLKKTP
jgi:hypothetical protein